LAEESRPERIDKETGKMKNGTKLGKGNQMSVKAGKMGMSQGIAVA
jgi:hypothetical protein